MCKEIKKVCVHLINEFDYYLAFKVGDVKTYPTCEEDFKEIELLNGDMEAWFKLLKNRTIARWDVEAERKSQK